MLSLAGLFLTALLSSTVLPGQSEAALFAFLRFHPDRVALALAVATAGNTLGGMTSYLMGRLLPSRAPEGRALAWVRRFGSLALLFAWLPVVGDALPLAAGWLRLNAWLCALFMAAGKLARYGVVAWAAGF
jgi:membrane protein YqaA with SNARE-associated domain